MADQRSSYDVFISFLGDKSSTRFTKNLCDEMTASIIYTYVAYDEISKGIRITQELVKVIQESRIAIIVFSDNYVSSSFCLDVLASIVDNFQENNNPKPYRLILPVYVDISPSDVQNQTGPYSEDKNKLIKWRNALSHVANLPAWNFKHGGGFDEFKIIKNIVEQVSRNFDPVPLHNAISDVVREDSQTSQSIHEVAQVMMLISHRDSQAETTLRADSDVVHEDSQTSQGVHEVPQVMKPISHRDSEAEMTWRVVGFTSAFAGMYYYALSPSSNRLIGSWKPFKLFVYLVVCLVISITIWFAKQLSLSTRISQLKKTCLIFAVLMIISVYSFFYDRAVDGKPDLESILSNAAFALVSVSLHKLFKFKSEIGVFSYFLCCFTVQLLTINLMLVFVAIIYGCLLSVIHSRSASDISRTVHKAVQDIMSTLHIQAETTWRIVGFMSCAAGLLCYALSPCFNPIIKLWEYFKVAYVILCFDMLTTILFTKAHSSPSTWYAKLKTYTSFAVLLMISMYGLFNYQYVDELPGMLIVVSNGSFALMSISLHKLFKFQYEIGMLSYFAACFTLQLLINNWRLSTFLAIIFGGPLLFKIRGFMEGVDIF